MAARKTASAGKGSGRKKTATRKKTTTRKKTSARKTSSARKKATGRKKSAGRKKATGRKKSSGRKYSRAAQESVREEMHEMKRGRARSGRSGRKVTNPKQAIAIGLSEARAEGKNVPPNPNRRSRKKSS